MFTQFRGDKFLLLQDELNTAKVALMANLSHSGLNALIESNAGNHSETEITSDSNIIPYSQYVSESQQPAAQNSNSFRQQDALILSMIEQLKTQVVNCTKINLDNKSVNDTLTAEVKRYKEQVKVFKEGQHVALKKQAVEQHHIESKTFEVKMNKVLNENERILEQVISNDIVNIIVNFSVDNTSVLQEKVLVIIALKDALKKLKGKALADVVTSHSIDLEMLNVDVKPLNPRLLNNRSAHSDNLKHTQEEDAILREIVEQGKSQNPLNAYLVSACKYTKLIQELLIIIRQTCPSFNNSSEKLVAVTPKNKDKRARFTEPVTPSGNTITNNASSSNLVSNKHALSSTGVKSSTRDSGSQPSGNTKKAKIQRPPSSTQKNKVEAYPRIVKTSLKNKNHTVEPKGTGSVQHSTLNANSKLICVKCNGCMLSDNHDLITTTTEVPSRKPIAVDINTPKPVVTSVHSRKPRKSKATNPVSKYKVIKSVPPNKKEPTKSWRSTVSNVPSSSLDECRNDNVAKIMGYGDYQIRKLLF
nr:hypothetical protein [Tanacetum cinerariifolium]